MHDNAVKVSYDLSLRSILIIQKSFRHIRIEVQAAGPHFFRNLYVKLCAK